RIWVWVWRISLRATSSTRSSSTARPSATPERRCKGCSPCQARLRRTSFAAGGVGDQALVGVAEQSSNVLDCRVGIRQDQIRVAQLVIGHHGAGAAYPIQQGLQGACQLVLISRGDRLVDGIVERVQVANGVLTQFPLPLIQDPYDHRRSPSLAGACCGCSALNAGGAR